MKNLIEVIKANKKGIIIKTLIVGGAVAGLALVMRAAKKTEDGEYEVTDEDAETKGEEEDSEE